MDEGRTFRVTLPLEGFDGKPPAFFDLPEGTYWVKRDGSIMLASPKAELLRSIYLSTKKLDDEEELKAKSYEALKRAIEQLAVAAAEYQFAAGFINYEALKLCRETRSQAVLYCSLDAKRITNPDWYKEWAGPAFKAFAECKRKSCKTVVDYEIEADTSACEHDENGELIDNFDQDESYEEGDMRDGYYTDRGKYVPLDEMK